MELPQQYCLEEQLIDGAISVGHYFSLLEKSTDYGKKLGILRTAEYKDADDNLYKNMLKGTTQEISQLQSYILEDQEWWKTQKNSFLESLYEGQRARIAESYEDLQHFIAGGMALIK